MKVHKTLLVVVALAMVSLPRLALAVDTGRYFLNISSPTEIKFFCEQKDKIVLIDQTGHEKYIPKAGPFKPLPDLGYDPETGPDCGMGHCDWYDLLGNWFGIGEPADDTKENREKKQADKEKEEVDMVRNGLKIDNRADSRNPIKKEGCRELEKTSASCVTQRRTIYVHQVGDKNTYTTYDFKSSSWDVASTDIASSQAKWEARTGGQTAIQFENQGYQYRFEIFHLNSLSSGRVSVFRDGNKIQSESCKLLYFDPDLMSPR